VVRSTAPLGSAAGSSRNATLAPHWGQSTVPATRSGACWPSSLGTSLSHCGHWSLADAASLLVATAAAHAVEYVGLPEAQLNLAQAVVHVATAPKSNRTALGIWKAIDDVRSRPAGPVPPHLRDAHYRSAERIGHGVGYRYPHDDPRGWVEQEYLPDELVGTRYYHPVEHGHEAEVAERLRRPDGDQP